MCLAVPGAVLDIWEKDGTKMGVELNMKSMADFSDITPYPRFLWNDQVLWQKYVESKYANIREAEKAHRHQRPVKMYP